MHCACAVLRQQPPRHHGSKTARYTAIHRQGLQDNMKQAYRPQNMKPPRPQGDAMLCAVFHAWPLCHQQQLLGEEHVSKVSGGCQYCPARADSTNLEIESLPWRCKGCHHGGRSLFNILQGTCKAAGWPSSRQRWGWCHTLGIHVALQCMVELGQLVAWGRHLWSTALPYPTCDDHTLY